MLWVKAFHIISLVCWFAGIFYLPRLFVYHAACEDTPGRERFKVMERKLYRGITTPSMIATVIFGVWLISYNVSGYFSQGWLHVKLLLVTVLDRKSTRLNSSHVRISYAVFCLKKKKNKTSNTYTK